MNWFSMLRAIFSVLIFSATGLAWAETVSTQNIALNHAAQVTTLQLGAACTLLLWAAIRFVHIRKKIYFFSLVTLIFSIARLLITQPNAFVADFKLTSAQIYLLMPFLNLGTMVNGLFTVHLATASEKTQDQRRSLFYLVFGSTLVIAILSLFTDRKLITGIAISILVTLVFIIVYDFIKSA